LKRKICIEIDSYLLDRVQVWGRGDETLDDFIEKTLEHMFECDIWWKESAKEEDLRRS